MKYALFFIGVMALNNPVWCQEHNKNLNQQHKTQKLTFALVPQQSAVKLAKKWIPIFQYLTSKTGIQLLFRTAPNIPAFEKKLAHGEYDIAYMNPYHYTVYSENPGYRAFAKAKDKKIKGILVTSRENPVTSFEQLNHKTLAFPAPAAFAATLLTQSALNKKKIDYKVKYVSSHDSVYYNVAKGLYPVGGGVLRTYGNISPKVREKLQIFYTTDGYTPHAFAAHPDLDISLVDKLQQAMNEMHTNDKGLKLLQSINIKGIETAHNSDWDDVRKLKISLKIN